GSLALEGVVFASGNRASGSADGSQAGAASQVRPLAGAVHADMTWTMRDGSTARSSADGGLITSVANGSITIRRSVGRSVTATVGASACIRKDGEPVTLGDLRSGERAVVVQGGG